MTTTGHEQHAGEGAVAAAADDQQFRAGGSLQQDLIGRAMSDRRAYLDRSVALVLRAR